MNFRRDIRDLIEKVTRVPDEEKLLALLSSLKPGEIKKPTRVAFVNAHALNLAWKDGCFLRHLTEADHVFRDGSGMKILYTMLGRDPGLNLNGTDLIPRIIELYAACSVAFLGTHEPHTSRAARKLQEKTGVNPVLVMGGIRSDEEYLEAVRRHRAPLIVLATGMPKQERLAALLAENLDYPSLIVCGGAILDFISGKVTRAPWLLRQLGMEWVYRLAQEPRRLFRRYVIGNFVFLYRSVLLTSASRSGAFLK